MWVGGPKRATKNKKFTFLVGLPRSSELLFGKSQMGGWGQGICIKYSLVFFDDFPQEAINAPTKKDVAFYSFRGSHSAQNLGCFVRNWMTSDPSVLEYAE